ncbi:MAG: NAD(P)-dependent oxidoreductase [Spirochaetaceae bacterium]
MNTRVIVFATSFLDELITHPPEEGTGTRILDSLEADTGVRIDYRCERHPTEPLTPAELDGATAVIADLEHYDAGLLDRVGVGAGGTLGLIARYGIGYDSIDVAAATAAGVIVSNTPGANARPTAEWAVATMLDVAGRRIPHYRSARSGRPKQGPSRLDVSGRTVGVVGTGSIGKHVVELLSGFRMNVIATDPYPDEEWAREHGVSYVSLEELCSRAQFITLHAAVKKQLIGPAQLDLMHPTTVLINCARGQLVDEEAAYRAVMDGELWGYGLDEIWTREDLDLDGLNIAVSPHVGSDTDSGKANMQAASARAVSDYVRGGRPDSVVNPEVLGVKSR